MRRFQWPCDLRRRSTTARLLRSWVRIPPGAWTFVCCVLSGRVLCDELITRPEESYRLWRVVVCDQENLVNEEAIARAGLQSQRKKSKRAHCTHDYLKLEYYRPPHSRTKQFLAEGRTRSDFRNSARSSERQMTDRLQITTNLVKRSGQQRETTG
jgi:hypothetical protein